MSGIGIVVKWAVSMVFGSLTPADEKGVIRARFLVWFLKTVKCKDLSAELKTTADLKRKLREARLNKLTAAQQLSVAKGVDKAEAAGKKDEARRKAAIDKQDADLKKLTDPRARLSAKAELDRQRDANAEDAADLLRQAQSAIEAQGGMINLPPKVRKALKAMIDGSDSPPPQVPLKSIRVLKDKDFEVYGKSGQEIAARLKRGSFGPKTRPKGGKDKPKK